MFESYLEKLVDALKEHLNKNIKINHDNGLKFTYKAPQQFQIIDD
jgi:hypothetical protein